MSRQCGKSLTIAARAVYNSLTKPGNLTLIVSVNQRSADELLRKVKQWALACKTTAPDLVAYSETASSISFENGSRILSLPANPASLRGFSGDIILDEFALVENDSEIYRAILPVITSQMTGGRKSVVVSSTPTSLDTEFAKIWYDESGKWKKYSKTIYDCVEMGLKADPETLKAVVNDDLIWQTEYMAEFASGSGTAFPVEWLWNIGYDKLPPGGRYFLGYDVARRKDMSAFVVLYEKDSVMYVVDIRTLKDSPYNEQLKFVKELNKKYMFSGGYTDSVGVGSMISEEISRTINAKIKPFSWNATNKTLLHDNLRALIQDGKFKVNPAHIETIKQDFAQVRRYISSTGRIAYTAPHSQDGHADITSAICLGIHSIHDNPVCISLP